ncbi:unnamed protein product, partial [Musa banksii]
MARAGGITNAVNVGIAVQADWENREFISNISLNVRRLFDFLLQFGTKRSPCSRIKLITLNFSLSFFSTNIEVINITYSLEIKFCASPEATTKSKLAALNEKLDILEHRLEVLEVEVSSATT